MSVPKEPNQPKPFINVHFRCCNIYARVHLNAQGNAFAGNCPRCCARLIIEAVEGGDPAKFWSAG